MRAALVLVDLQNDFLCGANLEPSCGEVVERAAQLLQGCRAAAVPVIHVRTTVRRDADARMPHWRQAGTWRCVEGTAGHEIPEPLRPQSSEDVIDKTFFSGYTNDRLEARLRELEVDTVILAGVHLHGCIRTTALDAYQRGFGVWIAEDAVASDDPLHAAQTRRYLEARATRFCSVDCVLAHLNGVAGEDTSPLLPATVSDAGRQEFVGATRVPHNSPADGKALWRVPIGGSRQVDETVGAAKRAWREWRETPSATRQRLLERLADNVAADGDALANRMAVEIGKPVTYARAEIVLGVALLRAAARQADSPDRERSAGGIEVHRRPLGVVAVVTPWNNPLAIPLGKIGPALLYGNSVVWKPAIPGTSVALRVMDLLADADSPPGLVNLVCGSRSTAELLLAHAEIDAATLTGSSAAGHAGQAICAERRIPFQAELGGNNAAIVWGDCDLERAARRIAEGAFGCAGQRCTANRRVIVDARCHDAFLNDFVSAVSDLVWGAPLDPATTVGPLVSEAARDRTARCVDRARAAGSQVIVPHGSNKRRSKLSETGAYYPPTIVCCDDPSQEIVQEETFAPIVVIQRAADWEEALRLCDGVRQGLVASLFSDSAKRRASFLREVRAGILKIDQATAGAGPDAPFGGWKASGVGPPEHGSGDREFYTRLQTVYGDGRGQVLT
jgi:acyl-CoA reductase-like NAD-dependent aldehyde dehydrogenase/nicotinamidase-related amidase